MDGRIRQAAGVWGIDVLGGNGDFHSTDGWLCDVYGRGEPIDSSLITGGVVHLSADPTVTLPTSTRVVSRAASQYRLPKSIAVDMWGRRNTASTQPFYASFWAGTLALDVNTPTNVLFNVGSDDMDWHHFTGTAVPTGAPGATLCCYRLSGRGWDAKDVTFIAQY